MIKNFDEIKSQLKDLSEVVNSFKSEAVQLRIVELVFGYEPDIESDGSEQEKRKPPRKKAASKKAGKRAKASSTLKKPGKKASSQGAVATLTKLVDEDFFTSPKSIADIVEHCEHNLARKFKANEFSGKLARLVRDGTLTRTKNSENQYEYKSK